MTTGDAINAAFELFGAWAIWGNVVRLRKDRDVKGIVWQYTLVYWLWGIWNLYYYPSLHQRLSFLAGCVLVAGNAAWLLLWAKICRDSKRRKRP